MKKQVVILLLAFFGIMQMYGQVTFKPGIRAGANFSHFTEGNIYDNYEQVGNSYQNQDKFSSLPNFYIGFFGELRLSKYYALQPEIDYSGQGSKFEFTNPVSGKVTSRNLNVSYLSLEIINKFIFNDFNIQLGPTLDFLVDRDFRTERDFDMAFVLGIGYNVSSNFGIEARVKKGIIPVFYDRQDNNDADFYYNGSNHDNVVFSIGATYTLNVK